MRGTESVVARLASAGALLLFCFLLLGGVRFFGQTAEKRGEEDSQEKSICHIRMTYPVTAGVSVITDIKEVEEAVNEIARSQIGVEVELIPVDMQHAREEYLLMLSRGETLDLMLIRDQDIHSYIDKGLVQSLSGYLARNADAVRMQDALLEGRLTKGTKQQGKIYGVSNLSDKDTKGSGLWISQAVLEQTHTAYDPKHVYSLEELDRLFMELKSLYPDSYPLGQITANQTGSSIGVYMDIGDALGGELFTGVIGENAVVENLFASGEYREFLRYMERWYNSGFIYPDSVIYEAPAQKLLEDQTILALPASSYPGTMDLMLKEETDYVCLRTTEVKEKESKAWDYWTVPSTSRYPAEAVEFLNLMYSDQRVAYLLNYGLSKKHYTISDAQEKLLAPVRREDGSIPGFYNPFAKIGDTGELYEFGTVKQQRQREAYRNLSVKENKAYEEFSYSTENVSRQVDEVKKVVDIYAPILESGSVNVQENYPEFLRALEEAGILEIIADKQAQIDSWLVQQTSFNGRD